MALFERHLLLRALSSCAANPAGDLHFARQLENKL